MSLEKPYEIHEEGLSGAVARLVEIMKRQEPGLGEFKATCHDGTTVEIKIEVTACRCKQCKKTKRPKRA